MSLYFSSNSFFYQKRHILVSSKSLPYALIFEGIVHKGIIFFRICFLPNKIFKTLFTKRNLVRYYFSINVYIMYQNMAFALLIFVFFNFTIAKHYNLSTHFIYDNKFFYFFHFYNTPLSSVKLACCSNFTASFLLILLITQR